MASGIRARGHGDIGSAAAFAVLFVVPAAVAVFFWIALRVLDTSGPLGSVAFITWLVVVLAPVAVSAAVARWACMRSATPAATGWGFAIGAAVITVLFMVVAAAWLAPGFGD